MTYKSLSVNTSQIRHLIIEPALNDTDELSCRLENVFLGPEPRFVALSYRWGDPDDQRRALVDGQVTMITASLDGALRGLRRRGFRRIWADGLCINQQDTEERAQQVTKMDAIYRSASRVLAWLGEEEYEGEAEDALSALQYLESPKNKSSELSSSSRDALWKLLQSEYWRRVWIIQEVSVNESLFILWGSQIFSIDSLCRLLIQNGAGLPPELNLQLRDLRNILYFRRTQSTLQLPGLLAAIYKSRRAQASDPRDKVFALRGLTFDGAILLPSPSYVRSLETTCIDLASQIVRTSSSLNILLLRSSRSNAWVPDLFDGNAWKPWWRSSSVQRRRIAGANYHSTTHYGAAKSWQASRGQRAEATVHRSHIEVKALIVDTIDGCFPTLSESLMPNAPVGATNSGGAVVDQAPKSGTKPGYLSEYDMKRKALCRGYKEQTTPFPRWRILCRTPNMKSSWTFWNEKLDERTRKLVQHGKMPANPYDRQVKGSSPIRGTRDSPAVGFPMSGPWERMLKDIVWLLWTLGLRNSQSGNNPNPPTPVLEDTQIRVVSRMLDKHNFEMVRESAPFLVRWFQCCEGLDLNVGDRSFIDWFTGPWGDHKDLFKNPVALPNTPRERRRMIENASICMQENLENGGMRLSFTRQGKLGWFRKWVQPGDEVAIVPGCDLPLVLRARPQGGYSLIGECIIPGLMFGEAMPYTKDDKECKGEYCGQHYGLDRLLDVKIY